MVAHLVHRAMTANCRGGHPDGKGSEHPFVQTLWNNLPLERNLEMSVAQSIDLNGLCRRIELLHPTWLADDSAV